MRISPAGNKRNKPVGYAGLIEQDNIVLQRSGDFFDPEPKNDIYDKAYKTEHSVGCIIKKILECYFSLCIIIQRVRPHP